MLVTGYESESSESVKYCSFFLSKRYLSAQNWNIVILKISNNKIKIEYYTGIRMQILLDLDDSTKDLLGVDKNGHQRSLFFYDGGCGV